MAILTYSCPDGFVQQSDNEYHAKIYLTEYAGGEDKAPSQNDIDDTMADVKNVGLPNTPNREEESESISVVYDQMLQLWYVLLKKIFKALGSIHP